MKQSNTTVQANTLGNLAKLYNMQVKTLYTLINANEALRDEINRYTAGVTYKAKKLLPPKLIENIFEVLGTP